MALTKEEKKEAIESARRNDFDTGSTEVQVAILTKKIEKLTEHMIKNPHDYSSKRGMNICIAHRKKLLNYLKRENAQKHAEISVKKKSKSKNTKNK